MIRGQCIINGIYMTVVHRTGKEDNIEFTGQSLVCNSRGEIIAKAGTHEGVVVTNIDVQECRDWHKHQRFLSDRRDSRYYAVD
ncbi:MAG: hypothetical protein HQM16_05610 [Deltaproteobacteria bacterium]|nr:hypothetical protein [Deltaproteobacteria bacterium]